MWHAEMTKDKKWIGWWSLKLHLTIDNVIIYIITHTFIIRYILYKLPKSTGDGLTYLYMDQTTKGWKTSREKINSSSGTVANTLRPLLDYYKKKVSNQISDECHNIWS